MSKICPFDVGETMLSMCMECVCKVWKMHQKIYLSINKPQKGSSLESYRTLYKPKQL